MNTKIKAVQYKIGPRIKQLREENELKQNELAKLIGVDRTSLSSYENCKRIPDIFMLGRIADIFNVSLDNLVGREFSGENANSIDSERSNMDDAGDSK